MKRGIEEILRSEVIAAANSRASKASAGDRRAGAVSGFLLSVFESWSHAAVVPLNENLSFGRSHVVRFVSSESFLRQAHDVSQSLEASAILCICEVGAD